jgi:hypothetical protein
MRLALLALLPFILLSAAPALAEGDGVVGLDDRLRSEEVGGEDAGARFEAVVTPAIGANVRRGPWGEKTGALPGRGSVTGRGRVLRRRYRGGTAFIHVNCLAPRAGRSSR